MEKTLAINDPVKFVVFDLLALAFIYFIPALSHLTSIPLYMLEPMRIAIILSLLLTGKKNTYIIALTIPLFSYFLSSHPGIIKSLLITSELIVNIYLFYFFMNKMRNAFLSMFISIISAKLFYYGVKSILIASPLMEGSLISTPILLQLAVALVLSIITLFVFKERKLL